MSTITLLLIALGLAMDAFAVAVATSVSLRRVSGRQVFRFGFHFGLFQALMPLLGWLGGRTLVHVIAGWDHWIAFGLLTFVGIKAIHESLRGDGGSRRQKDPTRGLRLVGLSLATSIDAFAVGLTFAMLQVDIWYPIALIGCVTSALTATGMLLGARIGAHFGQRVELAGGLILIAIGVKILVQHFLTP